MRNGLVGLSLLALLLTGCSSSSDGTTDIDQRTCEIFRDISSSVDIQTLEETRSRIEDLYSGYGQSTSTAIHNGLRDILEGLTSGDYDHASDGILATDRACKVEGF